jgi:hypothetical protein
MAGFPLPALDIRPPQPQVDPLSQFQKVMSLRSLMGAQQLQQQQIAAGQQEQQIRQQAITDNQAVTAAMKTWDGQDYDALAKSVLQNGGSANAATQIQQHGLTIKKTVSDIAAQDAATGSKNLDTFIAKHKAVGDALEGVESVPDDQLHDHAVSVVTNLTNAGVMDPQTAQQVFGAIQNTPDPKALRAAIDQTAKGSMGAKAAADLAKTQADTQKTLSEVGQPIPLPANIAQAAGIPERAGQLLPPAQIKAIREGIDQGNKVVTANGRQLLVDPTGKTVKDLGVAPAVTQFNLQQGSFAIPQSPQMKTMVDAVGNYNVPLQTMMARVPPASRANFMQALYDAHPDFDETKFGAKQSVVTSAVSGDIGKQLNSFNTAIEHLQTLSQLSDALNNGNVQALNSIGNAWATATGAEAPTDFGMAKTAVAGEIAKTFKGNATEGEIHEINSNISAAQSPAQLKGAIRTALSLLNSKRTALQDQYQQGLKGQPNFGQPAGEISATGPNGHKIVVRNGRWVDAQSGAQIQ